MANARLYLITPALDAADVAPFSARFAAALEAGDVASVLLRLKPGADAKRVIASLAPLAAARDAALLIEDDARLAARLGVDGVHVASDQVAEAVESARGERIVGAGLLRLRDDAMAAGEAGADYVMFGEPARGVAPPLEATLERVEWWAEIFRDPLRRLRRPIGRRRPTRRRRRRFHRPRRRGVGSRCGGGRARGDEGALNMRTRLVLALWLASTGAALAFDPNSPMFQAPTPREVGPDSPLKPKPGDPPGDLAYGAYQRGYYITALREAQKRLDANPRDAAAMTLIGEIYHDGFALKRDDEEAARWWRLAAERGDVAGAYEYGVALLSGAGVAADNAAARKQFTAAAATGHLGALYNLGVLALQGGADGKPDYAAAAAYFRRAAEAGDGNAAYSYGVLVREGKGVPLDTDAAALWLKRASDDGIIAGQVEYAIMLFNGVGVEKDEAGAANIFRLAAARRNPIAQNRLAHLYLSGRGVPKDVVRAALWSGLARSAGLKDDKLDQAIGQLTQEQVNQVNELARQQAEF